MTEDPTPQQPTPPKDGLSGNIHEDGRIELLTWANGECVNSFYVSDEENSNLIAALLLAAHQSSQVRGLSKPMIKPHAPSIPISAASLIANRTKKTFALGFGVGQSQVVLQIPQSILASLGRQLLAASAQEGKGH